MALLDINWTPDEHHLRRFGLVSFGVAVLIAGAALWRARGTAIALETLQSWRVWAPLAMGGIAAVIGLIRPRWLKPFYLGLTVLTWPIGWCISYLVLAVVFIVVFTPVAIIFRLLGRDALHRRFDRAKPTYWIRRSRSSTPASYLRQS